MNIKYDNSSAASQNQAESENLIMCPYCFRKFAHDRVHFRLETVNNSRYTQTDIENTADPDERAHMEREYNFRWRDDPRYLNHWSEFGGTTEITPSASVGGQGSRGNNRIEIYQHPVVDPSGNDEEFGRELEKYLKLQPDGGYYIRDSGGMVEMVEDIFGVRSSQRVCPHCHNPLPRGYGKHDVKFISIVGMTGAGKTVYISQLLRLINRYTTTIAGMSAHATNDRVNNFIKSNRVARNVYLPKPNRRGKFAQPLTFDLVVNTSGDMLEVHTIVLYDISGEDCVDLDGNGIGKYGKFVKHSDAIMLLVRPNQFGFDENYTVAENTTAESEPVLENATSERPSEREAEPPTQPEAVMSSLHLEINKAKEKKCKTPVAVCISKSDFVLDAFRQLGSESSEFLQLAESDIRPYINPTSKKWFEGFNATDYNIIQKRLTEFMKGQPLDIVMRDEYSCYNYFMFSAINCKVATEPQKSGESAARSFPLDDPVPIRIAEPLLWIFRQLGFIGSNTYIRLPVPREFNRYVMGYRRKWYKYFAWLPWVKQVPIKMTPEQLRKAEEESQYEERL